MSFKLLYNTWDLITKEKDQKTKICVFREYITDLSHNFYL